MTYAVLIYQNETEPNLKHIEKINTKRYTSKLREI